MRLVNTNANGKIPRHEAYATGIAAASYDLEQLILAFGASNVMAMIEAITAGQKPAVDKMLRKWTMHRFGDKFAMIDHICYTETAYGLTQRAAANNGASTKLVD
jgi:hypothetical protein